MKVKVIFLFFFSTLFWTCKGHKKVDAFFQDMYDALPENKSFGTLQIKGKIASDFRIYYILEDKKNNETLVVSMLDKDTSYRLKEYKTKLHNIATANGVSVQEILDGILFKTHNFCKTVTEIIKSCEKKEEFTSFKQTKLYKVGYTVNRLDAVIKNRYFLTIYLHTLKDKQYDDFEKFINPYFNQFNFDKLKK